MITALKITHKTVQWTARILSLLLIGLILLFLFGEGFPPLHRFEPALQMMFVCELVTLIGLGLGWKYEVLGGTLAVLGMAGFYTLNYASSGKLPGPIFLLYFIAGLLYLTSYVLTKPNSTETVV